MLPLKRDPLHGVPREVVARFNKILHAEQRKFRMEMGEIIARQAGSGILMSGYTIRQCVDAAERCLERGIQDCLTLVQNRTEHNGKKRRAMLKILIDVSKHHANGMGEMIAKRFGSIEAFGGDAAVTRDFEFRQMVERRVDQIQAFSDGLTALPDKPWTKRHPLVAVGVGAAITLAIGMFFGLFEGVFEALGLLQKGP